MDIKNIVIKPLSALINGFKKLSLLKKIIVLIIFAGLLWFIGKPIVLKLLPKKVTYQTDKAAKGTFTTSISGSGTISSGNSTNITTGATGIVKEVYVVNGDTVVKGQNIASITLDDYGAGREATYWASYTDALVAVQTAEKEKIDDDIQMWKDRQTLLDAEDTVKDKNLGGINPATKELYTLSEQTVVDKSLDQANKAFEASQLKYKNADAAIAKAQAKVAAAWRSYQEVSATVVAPAAGVVNNLTLSPGVVISSTSTSNTTSGSSTTSSDSSYYLNTINSQTLGKVYNSEGQLQATVSLSEIDIVNVKSNQKVTLTLDAYADKTFTGKVLAVDTTGSVSSGVTTYPVTILIDHTTNAIYPNMAVNASIITSIKKDVILVTTSAIQTTNGKSSVLVLKNGKPVQTTVEIGSSNDTQTEIKSGVNVGDEIVTATITTDTSDQNTDDTSSPFSSTNSSSSKSSSTKSNSSVGGMGGGMGGPPGM